MSIFRKVFLLVFLAVATLTAAFTTSDTSSATTITPVMFDPTSLHLTLSPGVKHEGSFTIRNLATDGIDIRLSATPYSIKNNDYDHPDTTSLTDRTLLSGWITFDKTNYHIAGEDDLTIRYYINPPDIITTPGGQYASITATILDISGEPTTQTYNMVAYAVIQDGNTRVGGRVLSQSAGNLYLSGPVQSTSTIENTGNIELKISHFMTVENIFSGATVFSSDDAESYILPSTARTITTNWQEPPMIGVFKVYSHLTILGQDYDKETIIIIFPLFLIILIPLIILLAIATPILIRKKRQHKK